MVPQSALRKLPVHRPVVMPDSADRIPAKLLFQKALVRCKELGIALRVDGGVQPYLPPIGSRLAQRADHGWMSEIVRYVDGDPIRACSARDANVEAGLRS